MTPVEPAPLPPPRAAIGLFVAVLLSNFAMGLLLASARAGANWILVGTPLVVLFWTVLALRYFRVDVRETLLLHVPSRGDLLMALPLAFSFVILSDQLSNFSENLIPPEIKAQLLEMVRVAGPADWIVKVATIGLGAALSEELMLRGFILSVFCRSMSRTSAVLFTALLFMALHILPLPSIAAAGVVLGFTALATRSIAVPIVIHFVNNLYVLALVNLAHLETLGDPVWIPPEILVPAIAIFVLTMAYYARHLLSQPSPARGGPGFPGSGSLAAGRPDGEDGEGEREERDFDLAVRPARGHAPKLSEELSAIPPARRRLGFLVVLLAVVVGTSVLLGLFVYTVHMVRPQTIHKALIQTMSQDTRERLAPEARGRENELVSSFQTLEAVSEVGGLDETRLWTVLRVYFEVVVDGRVDSAEADTLIQAIHQAVEGATSPRRL